MTDNAFAIAVFFVFVYIIWLCVLVIIDFNEPDGLA
jgi:hypothetical protein